MDVSRLLLIPKCISMSSGSLITMSTSSRSGLPGRLGQVSDDQKERQGVDHQEGKGSQIVRPLSGKMTQNSPQEYGRANRRSWKYCVGHKKRPGTFRCRAYSRSQVSPVFRLRFAVLLAVFTVAFVLVSPAFTSLLRDASHSVVRVFLPWCLLRPTPRFRHAIRSVCQCLSHGFSCDPPLCP